MKQRTTFTARPNFKTSGIAGLLAALLIAAVPAQGLPRKLPPVDQCAGDPSFVKFRAALIDIAKREDSKALLRMFAPDAEKPTGYGPVAAGEKPDPNDIMPEEDWVLVRMILRMGCVRSNSGSVMPSITAQLKRYRKQDLKDKVLLLPGTKLFEDPTADAKNPLVIATLEWDVATITSRGGDLWTGVRSANGRDGYVSNDELYQLDADSRYEIRFEKRRGTWMIIGFW